MKCESFETDHAWFLTVRSDRIFLITRDHHVFFLGCPIMTWSWEAFARVLTPATHRQAA
jgi:hypothetical protein